MNPTVARQPIPASAINSAPLPKPPAIIAPLVSGLLWERMAELSGQLMLQLRRLGASCEEGSAGRFELIVDDPTALTPVAAAHAWMVAMAQPAALEMRRMEIEAEAEAGNEVIPTASEQDPRVTELAAVALLAGCTNPRGSGRRLVASLQRVARELAQACVDRGVNVQFMFARPLQSVSPVTHQTAVPLATCRIRAAGVDAEGLRQILKQVVHGRTSLSAGEVLVLSVL